MVGFTKTAARVAFPLRSVATLNQLAAPEQHAQQISNVDVHIVVGA